MKYTRRTIRLLLAVILTISLLTAHRSVASDLRSRTNQADYLVITPTCYISQAQHLATFRTGHDGLSAMVVPLDTITAQFHTGSTADSSLREFLDCALSSWTAPRPSAVVLMGNVNVMPTHVEPELPGFVLLGYTDSVCTDHWFVEGSVGQSGYGQMRCALGRMPGWDSAEISTMVNRTISYETGEPEPWWGRVVGLADYNSVDLHDFENALQGYQRTLAAVWTDTVTVTMDSTSSRFRDSTGFRSLWDQGASILVYVGHANAYNLAAIHYFTAGTASMLHNAPRLPLFLSIGCALRYDLPVPTIASQLMSNPSGGAIASVISAGIQWFSTGDEIVGGILGKLGSSPTQTAGAAFRDAKDAQGCGASARRYTYLGDPALHVKRPTVIASIPEGAQMPAAPILGQNYPNPFNPSTTISYVLPSRSHVKLEVFNTLGQEIAVLQNDEIDAGYHEVHFLANGLASGVYYYRLIAGSSIQTRRLVLLR